MASFIGNIPHSGVLKFDAFTPDTPGIALADLWVTGLHDMYVRAVTSSGAPKLKWMDPTLILPNRREMIAPHLGVVMRRLSSEVDPVQEYDDGSTLGAHPEEGRLVHDATVFQLPGSADSALSDILVLRRTVELPAPGYESETTCASFNSPLRYHNSVITLERSSAGSEAISLVTKHKAGRTDHSLSFRESQVEVRLDERPLARIVEEFPEGQDAEVFEITAGHIDTVTQAVHAPLEAVRNGNTDDDSWRDAGDKKKRDPYLAPIPPSMKLLKWFGWAAGGYQPS